MINKILIAEKIGFSSALKNVVNYDQERNRFFTYASGLFKDIRSERRQLLRAFRRGFLQGRVNYCKTEREMFLTLNNQ